jgi:hypothetical protein
MAFSPPFLRCAAVSEFSCRSVTVRFFFSDKSQTLRYIKSGRKCADGVRPEGWSTSSVLAKHYGLCQMSRIPSQRCQSSYEMQMGISPRRLKVSIRASILETLETGLTNYNNTGGPCRRVKRSSKGGRNPYKSTVDRLILIITQIPRTDNCK